MVLKNAVLKKKEEVEEPAIVQPVAQPQTNQQQTVPQAQA